MSSHYKSIPGSLDSFFREAKRYKPLSKMSEQRLAVRCVKGDQKAMEILVKHNLLFTVSQAKKHVTATVELEDLIQECIMGMYVAAEKFKPVGIKFVSYAVWYMRASCQRYKMGRAGLIKWPYGFTEISKHLNNYANGGGRKDATPDEVRKALSLSKRKMSDFRQEGARWSTIPPLSLDAPISHNGDSSGTHLEMIVGNTCTIRDLGVAKSRRSIDKVMGCLSEREAYCINRYFLEMRPRSAEHETHDGDTTYDDIAAELGLTRERIRQVINEAMKKMRGRKHGDVLRVALKELV